MSLIGDSLDEKSSISSARICMYICVLVGCGIGIAGLVMGKDLNAVGILSGVFLGAGLGIKVGNKAFENKGLKDGGQ